ncbi:MAG: alpha/beta hydrolase [Micromonosporaceae bacterium]
MSLTSGLLIGLAGFLAVTAFAGTMWAWRRVAGPRPSHVLARVSLLVWAQVTVMLVLFLSVNRSFGFFASWSDLFGTNHTTGVIVAPDRQGHAQPAGSRAANELVTRGGRSRGGWPPALAGRHGTWHQGQLRMARIAGVRSGISATAYVYLPPQYFEAKHPEASRRSGSRFPVVVVISDHVAAARDPYGAVSIALTAAAQIEAGRARPAIYVMLSPAAAGARDSACLDVPGGPQAATFFSQDLPAAIGVAYPASVSPAGWAVIGDVSGGYCALSLAMAHSDRFAVAAAPAARYGPPPGMTGTARGSNGWWISGGSAAIRNEEDLAWRLSNLPPPPISVFVTRPVPVTRTGRGGQPDTFLSHARRPMHVTEITLAGGPQPLAPLLDSVTSALTPRGPGPQVIP